LKPLCLCSLQRSQRPVVHFCDLAKYVKDKKPAEPDHTNIQSAASATPFANASFTSTSSPGISLSTEPGELKDVDLDGVDKEQELDDDLWEDEDAEEEENDRKRMAAAREVASSTVMDIEGISLQAWDLLDLLSDSPTSRTLAINEARPKTSKKMNSREPKVFQVSDIQF